MKWECSYTLLVITSNMYSRMGKYAYMYCVCTYMCMYVCINVATGLDDPVHLGKMVHILS